MIIIERKDAESIDRMLKRYKNKHRRIKLRDEIRKRKEFVKPSVKRRMEILSAKYKQKKYSSDD